VQTDTPKYDGPRSFRAVNNDPQVRRIAERVALQLSAESGRAYAVRYHDHYNDYSVVGDFVVVPL
jgi:hypothetical protein